jgi:hypothetical protein
MERGAAGMPLARPPAGPHPPERGALEDSRRPLRLALADPECAHPQPASDGPRPLPTHRNQRKLSAAIRAHRQPRLRVDQQQRTQAAVIENRRKPRSESELGQGCDSLEKAPKVPGQMRFFLTRRRPGSGRATRRPKTLGSGEDDRLAAREVKATGRRLGVLPSSRVSPARFRCRKREPLSQGGALG